MKSLRISFFMVFVLLTASNQGVNAYAISHNADSALHDVHVFVFTSKEQFENMLKKQGISDKTIQTIGKFAPTVAAGAGTVAEIAGFQEIKPALIAGGKALSRATKYAIGPAKWAMEQKYSVALHKNVIRGNKGKGAAWNWKDIAKDKGIQPSDKHGLFAVFLNPTNNEILLMTPMRSNAGLGFIAEEQGGKVVGELAPFEKNTNVINKDEAKNNPSYLAAVYHRLQGGYKDPHKIWSGIKSKFKSLKQKTSSGKDIAGYLKQSMQDAKSSFTQMSLPEKQDVINFFNTELQGIQQVAQDVQTQKTITSIIADVKHLMGMYDDLVVQTGKEYKDERAKGSHKGDKSSVESVSDALQLTHQALPISPKKKKQTFKPEQERTLRESKRQNVLTQKVREGFNGGKSIEKGINPAALQRLKEQVQSAQSVVRSAIDNGDAPSIYNTYMAQLNTAMVFLQQLIDTLHGEYHQARYASVDDALRALPEMKKQLKGSTFEQQKDRVLAIYGQLVDKITGETAEPRSWVDRLPRLATSVLNDASEKLFKAYEKRIKKNGQLNDKQLQELLAQHQMRNTMQVRTLLEDMQKYAYKQEHDKLFTSKSSLNNAQQLLKQLRVLYPDLLTLKDAEQIDNSLDVPTSILLTQAQGLAMAMNDLSTELLELENKLQRER